MPLYGPPESVEGNVGSWTEKRTEPMDDTPDECTFRVDKNASIRLGIGWGFKQSKQTTVAVRLDFNYWVFSVSPGEDQPMGAPIPREIPRPQNSYSIMVGLEFMRWKK